MLITKESSYILIRLFLTIIVIPADVLSRPKYPWFLIDPLHEPVCEEEQCKTRSRMISEYLKKSFDPCTNFYRYVCGGWQEKHPVPPSRTIWNMETEIDHKVFLRMRDQLEKPVTLKDSMNLKRSKLHFQTCSILPSKDKLNIEEVRERIKVAGPWPMMMTDKDKKASPWNWADIHYYYFKLTSDAGLFDVDISVDPQDHFKPVLELKALHSPFGLIQRDILWKPLWIRNYYNFIAKLVIHVVTDRSVRVTEKSLIQSVKDVFGFRKRLEEAVTDEVLDANAYHPLTVRELQYWSDNNLVTQDNKKLNWLKTLNSLFLKSSDGVLTTNTRVNVKHKKFFLMLAKIISETPSEIIVNHFHIYFIERYLLLDTNFETMAHNLITVNGMNIGTIRQLDIRWERCISKSNVRHAIDEIYISRFLTDTAQKEVNEIYNAMKDIVKMHVIDATWLNEENKRRTLLRIDDVRLSIGFPNPSSNVKIYGKFVDPNSVHAFYSVDTNRIFISGSYLQAPMYTENLPYVVNYGSIGSLIGHEFYHIFDRIGVSYSIYPKETCKTLWTPDIFQIYEEKAKCIVEQYNRRVKELLNIPHAPRNDGRRTYNENFADVMSIRTSYDAFKKRLIAENRTCTILPDLEGINCDRLFFISYAMTFCASTPQWKTLRQVQTSKHSVPELRVNIPVANMPEFSKAFECDRSSYENSLKRCYFWD